MIEVCWDSRFCKQTVEQLCEHQVRLSNARCRKNSTRTLTSKLDSEAIWDEEKPSKHLFELSRVGQTYLFEKWFEVLINTCERLDHRAQSHGTAYENYFLRH